METSQATQRSESAPSPKQPVEALTKFLDYLARGEYATAHSLVAPSSKEFGDPIAYRAKLDFDSFLRELPDPAGLGKFRDYELGQSRWESPDCFRIMVTFGEWDNDETQIVRENGMWYVADPIHVIR